MLILTELGVDKLIRYNTHMVTSDHDYEERNGGHQPNWSQKTGLDSQGRDCAGSGSDGRYTPEGNVNSVTSIKRLGLPLH